MRFVGFLKQTPLKRGTKQLSRRATFIKKAKRRSYILHEGLPILSLSEADNGISLYIRKRDGKCLRCGSSENLTCSHYHGRLISSTRFDPKNLITLCIFCHTEWETQKEGIYKDFMISLIGQEEFDFLAVRAKSTMKQSAAIIECMKFLKTTVSPPMENDIKF